jgi:nucleotide-binding universal stress UspA family protein
VSDRSDAVIAAVDFGEASAAAVRAAGYLAGRFDAPLRLVHAETIEAPPYFTPDQIDALEAQRRNTRAQAERYLTAFGRRETASPFEAVISEYEPVEAILREADRAGLVVMGTHGRRGPARWWLGSVAERVLREIRRPLLVVRAGARVDGLAARIAVHASNGPGGGAALDWARALAAGGGEVFDWRAASRAADGATIEVIAVPQPRDPRWLAEEGEPWLRRSAVPIAFIPESGGLS